MATRKATSVTSMLLLLTVLIVPSVYVAYAQATITVSTDKTSYVPGNILKISGTVSPVTAGQDVAILVYGPVGELKAVDQATPAADGKYSKDVMTFAPGNPSGTWSVKATYQAASSAASFTFTGVQPRTDIILTVVVSSGSMFAGGEQADIYVHVSYAGKSLDSNLTGTLYGPGTTTAKVAMTKLSMGLYRGTYAVPATASVGTYTVAVEAVTTTSQYLGYGAGLYSFQVSSAFADIKTALTGLNKTVTSLSTDMGTLKTGITNIQGKFPITIDITPIWVAVILSLIAAVAAIFTTITVQRKIA